MTDFHYDSNHRLAVYNRATRLWNRDGQVIKCVEELAELQKILCKSLLEPSFDNENLIEELADVSIMIEQMRLNFVCTTAVDDMIQVKVRRLDEKLKKLGG